MTDGPRFFTLAEAERTLPLVRRIVADIMERHAELRDLLDQREQRRRTLSTPGSDLDSLESRMNEKADDLKALVHELQDIGCIFKGFDHGLVDFYSVRDGAPVFLCWKAGEDRIRFWHSIDDGFAGRTPIENPDDFGPPPSPHA